MEYICLGIIFGILGGILNSPIFFIIVIILDPIIIICIYFLKNIIKNFGINKKRFLKYIIIKSIIIISIMMIMFLVIRKNEEKINEILKKDKNIEKGEYIVSVIDIKEGKYKNTYSIILKNINRNKLFKNKWKNICKEETYAWKRL